MFNKWDYRFMELAKHISSWSKDPSTKVGAVLVSPDKSQVVHGYNGFPRGVRDVPAYYEDKDIKYSMIVHAELNAILNSAVRPIGWTLYVYPLPPCNECAKAIIQSGIKRIVLNGDVHTNPKWLEAWKISFEMFKDAGIEVQSV